jgi:ABC-type Mn2+/Zn2+ transport system permease subunit
MIIIIIIPLSKNMLEVENLAVSYHDVSAVEEVSFAIASGQMVAVISPSATAYLLVRELHLMMGLGAIIGVLASVSGMYVSYYQNVPSGSAIVLIISGFFLLALLFSPSQGILTKRSITRRVKSLLSKYKS